MLTNIRSGISRTDGRLVKSKDSAAVPCMTSKHDTAIARQGCHVEAAHLEAAGFAVVNTIEHKAGGGNVLGIKRGCIQLALPEDTWQVQSKMQQSACNCIMLSTPGFLACHLRTSTVLYAQARISRWKSRVHKSMTDHEVWGQVLSM